MKNKSIKRILALGLAASLSISSTLYASDGKVTADVLNVRSGPSLSHKVIDQTYYGEQVSILSKEDNWYRIQTSYGPAYVHSNYIKETNVTTPTTKQGNVTANILNVRSGPSLNHSIINKFHYGKQVSILSKENNWFKISTDSGIAYVHSDYIQVENSSTGESNSATQRTGTVTVNALNLRSTPVIASNNKIGSLSYERVTILEEKKDWYYIQTKNGQLGYVYASYVVQTPENISELRQSMIEYGKQFLGNRYVYGGTSLTNGVDCSSFTQQIYSAFGYRISRTSYTQINNGVRISASELLPGDLVFYGYNGRVSHVAMYIGNGQILHASSPSTGIIISDMYRSYGKPYIGAVRIIQ